MPQLDKELIWDLAQLVSAQLILQLPDIDPAYLFKHALMQETAYESLLLKIRPELHRRVAEAYEVKYHDRLDDYAAVLSYHFAEAGEHAKTLEYARRAGEGAVRVYAYAEAIAQYSRALNAADQLHLPTADLLHARGEAFEFLGNFDQALSDFEAMLAEARSRRDSLNEWRALMDLGYLWSMRDYAKVGDLFRQALELAGKMGDAKRRAETLNRLANWLDNTGQVEEGLAAHQEALRIFEEQGDREGIAETHDLLSTTYAMHGDFFAATEHIDRAVEVFRELDNQPRLISSLSGRTASANSSSTETATSARVEWAEYERVAEEALQKSREIGWASGQAFALVASAQTLPGYGRLGLALERGLEGLRIAQEIGHDQWIAGAQTTLGEIYLYLQDPERAIEHLEPGLELSRKLGSAFWIADTATRLARAYMLKEDLTRARQVLDPISAQLPPAQNSWDRQLAWACGLLALKERRSQDALDISEQLIATMPGAGTARPGHSPALYKLKGEALVQQKQYERGIEALETGREAARTDNLAILWEIELALGEAYLQAGSSAAAAKELASAREDLRSLAATVPDDALRDHMLEAALRRFPEAKTTRRPQSKG